MRKMQALVRLNSEGEDEEEHPHLDWKDYIAFIIALLETSLLPILIVLGVLIVFVIILWLVKPSAAMIFLTRFLMESHG